jgi:hypothetical protein
MEEDFYSRMSSRAAAANQPSSVRPVLLTALAAFLLGGAAVGTAAWFYGFDPFGWNDSEQAPQRVQLASPNPAASSEASTKAAAAVQAVEIVAGQQGGIEARVTAMEQRLTALDIQAQQAYGNASRAEALLVALAARRAVERGSQLAYLEDQLKVRFGDAYPKSVAAVLAEAERPVTLDQLIARLDGLAPGLLAAPDQESAWSWFSREIGELFIVRKASTPSPAPAQRLDRARLFLDTGQVDKAIAEVRQMPGSAKATNWLNDAGRYAEALNALDLIETSAILGPENAPETPKAPAKPSGAQ